MNADLMTIGDVALYFGVQRRTASDWAQRGLIPGVRQVGAKYYVLRSAIVQWFEDAQVAPKARTALRRGRRNGEPEMRPLPLRKRA